jgi:DNA-binding NtrC family response regulator
MTLESPRQVSPVADDRSAIRSNSYHAMLLRLERIARDETATVLLEGESGTGKTTLARRIHEWSPRARGPFHQLVLSALDDGVAGSDLAGHVAGAYTDARQSRAGHFVSAKGGTLFLDEIAKASLAIQNKLLNSIEYKELTPVGADRPVKVDARIVVATNVDLSQLVAEGKFLPDLYARLRYFRVIIPPLRDRRADIPGLVADSLRRHAPHAGYARLPALDEALQVAVRSAPWTDNIRGLDSFIHRLLIEADGSPVLTLGHCTGDLGQFVNPRRDKRSLSDAEVAAALQSTGSLSEAARVLGIDRKTLRSIAARMSGGESQRTA